jgi:hypothetical protein
MPRRMIAMVANPKSCKYVLPVFTAGLLVLGKRRAQNSD